MPPRAPRPLTSALTGTHLAKQFKNFWSSTFQPELFSDRALEADPLFARYKAQQGVVRAQMRGGVYAVRSAYILSKRQIPDMVSGARRAGAQILHMKRQAARSPESGSGNQDSSSGTRFEGVADFFGSSSEPPQKSISPFTDAGRLEFNPDA